MDHENAVANIKKARSAPQKNKRLQAIHEAHVALLSKQAKIDEFESNLVVMREARPGRKVTMALQGNVNFIADVNTCVGRVLHFPFSLHLCSSCSPLPADRETKARGRHACRGGARCTEAVVEDHVSGV